MPARWAIGPPAPRVLAWAARAVALAILVVVGHWVHAILGGVGVKPKELPEGNDTSPLFNWHPILMVLAFVVLMTEALLAYQAPPAPGMARPARKTLHYACHSAAAVLMALGFLAVYRSHTLKLPAPMPDFYSPHSWLGLTALGLMACQYALGAYAYLWPKLPLPHRMALGPLHRFVGAATWLAGLGAVASGLQEKVTFMQMAKALPGGVYSAAMRLPACVLPLLVLLAVLVLYFQVPPAPRPGSVVGLAAECSTSGSGLHGAGSETQGLLRGVLEDDEESAHHRS